MDVTAASPSDRMVPQVEGTAGQRAMAIGALILLAVAAAVSPTASAWWRAVPVAGLIGLALCGLARPGPGSAVAVLAAAIGAVSLSGVLWQVGLPLALGIFALATRWVPRLGGTRIGRGRLPGWATFVCAAVTPGALAGWVWLLRPNVRDLTEGIPDVPVAVLAFGAVAFAVLNALFEEWVWRGVLLTRLRALVPLRAAVALQAISFGAAHAHGFPRGVVGVGLAGTWGAMLGVLSLRAGGLLAPVVAHVVADATIAAIVLLWLRS